ncbi:MAG: phosphatase PAP2 family protein, partial [Bacteroidia bacterium]
MFKKSIAQNAWFIIPFLIFQVVSLYIVPFGNKNELFLKLHPLHNSFTDIFFKMASGMVEWWGWVFAAILSLFIKVRYGIYAVFTLLLSGLWTLILKHKVFADQMRPSFNIDHSLLQLVDGVDLHTHHSFPSGHTIAAFSIFTVLTVIISKKWKPVGLLFFTLALIS